jgi:hypothetical protein
MKEQIEEMGKLCPFHEEGKCNLLEDEVVCDFDCDMCDYADALYNAGYRKQSEWISVDERLPEEGVRVLVWLKGDGSQYTRTDTDRLSLKKWVRCGRLVTHWMPLPEPPKMKGGAE